MKRNTGARGLRAVLEEKMLDVMYDIPSRRDISKVIITKDVIMKSEIPVLVSRERRARKKEETA